MRKIVMAAVAASFVGVSAPAFAADSSHCNLLDGADQQRFNPTELSEYQECWLDVHKADETAGTLGSIFWVKVDGEYLSMPVKKIHKAGSLKAAKEMIVKEIIVKVTVPVFVENVERINELQAQIDTLTPLAESIPSLNAEIARLRAEIAAFTPGFTQADLDAANKAGFLAGQTSGANIAIASAAVGIRQAFQAGAATVISTSDLFRVGVAAGSDVTAQIQAMVRHAVDQLRVPAPSLATTLGTSTVVEYGEARARTGGNYENDVANDETYTSEIEGVNNTSHRNWPVLGGYIFAGPGNSILASNGVNQVLAVSADIVARIAIVVEGAYDKGYQDGFSDGYDAGYEDGFRDGFDAAGGTD